MKSLLPIFLLLFLGPTVFARPVAYWPYDKLSEKADLIVIATPVAVRDTSEKTSFPGQSLVSAIGVETSFEVLSVLKGEKSLKKIVLHHLRAEKPKDIPPSGPMPITFKPTEKKRFLLFLKLESDGRYRPLTGQIDPVDGIKDLGAYP
jgi:hypothetical protein